MIMSYTERNFFIYGEQLMFLIYFFVVNMYLTFIFTKFVYAVVIGSFEEVII